MDRILAAESIGKRFGTRWVLRSAGLWATATKVSVLLGSNGSGKTTLIRISVGRLRADHGIIIFAGESTRRPRLHDLATRGLFYIPDGRFLCPRFTVREHLDAVCRRFRKARVDEAVQLLRLDPILDSRPLALSGGERRRAAVAVAVARRPHCLIADEPFFGLMPTDIDVLSVAFRALADEGCGVLLTGHEVRPLLAVADDVYWMTAGTTHYLGDGSQAREHHQFQREYLNWRG